MMRFDHSTRKRQAPLIPLHDKVEQLRASLDEVQKYELLTTNQYLHQMELVLEILDEISVRAEPLESITNPRRGRR